MLTRKQSWRRVRAGNESINKKEGMLRALSESTIATSGVFNSECLSRRKSDGDLKKRVRFSNTAKVVLVPSRQEYQSHGIDHDVWWKPQDYFVFKTSARAEVCQLIDKYSGDLRAVLRDLYQPLISD